MALLPIIGSRLENILRDATWSGTAPSTSYALTTYVLMNPAARVRYGSGTATVTATISSRRGDVLVIPVSNIDAGSTRLTLTNGAGLNVVIPVPVMPANGIPLTIVADLTLLQPNAATRTSTTWNVVITGNSANVILGGAILIFGPLNQFGQWSFQWPADDTVTGFGVEHENAYGVRYLQRYETQQRSVMLYKLARTAETTQLRNWFTDNGGRYGAGLLWIHPDVNDALYGTWQVTFKATQLMPTGSDFLSRVELAFDELVKGKPVV